MALEEMIIEAVRGLPVAKQQAVLDFAQFLVSKNGGTQFPIESHDDLPSMKEDLDGILKEIRGEWLEELDSMERYERGETDVIA